MIEFNYNKAIDQAKKLQDIAGELRLISQKLASQQLELAGAWHGDGANLFLKKAEDLCGDITATAKIAEGIGIAVNSAAGAIKAAEDAAKEIIKAVTV